MSVEWVAEITTRFGEDKVVDLLAGTAFEDPAQELGFGMYVVRNAMPVQERRALESKILDMFDGIQVRVIQQRLCKDE